MLAFNIFLMPQAQQFLAQYQKVGPIRLDSVLFLIVPQEWIGQQPSDLHLAFVCHFDGISEGHLWETTIDQEEERHPMGTFHPAFHGLDPQQRCIAQSHNFFFYKHLNLMHPISKLVLIANTFIKIKTIAHDCDV